MPTKYNWAALHQDMAHKAQKSHRKRGRDEANPYHKRPKKHYKAAYNTTPLEDDVATRGEGNAKNLALQRGKTLVTKKKTDEQRAQTITAKTFDGIDILNNFINYDQNVIKQPDLEPMAAQFGNFHAASVEHGPVPSKKGLVTFRPCPF